MKSLKNEIKRLFIQKPLPDGNYYKFTILLNDQLKPFWSANTERVDLSEEDIKTEIRKPDYVIPEHMIRILKDLGEPPLIINSDLDFGIFILFGGHGIILEEVIKRKYPELLEPLRSVNLCIGKGYIGKTSFPTEAFNRAPSKKLRMQILKRDQLKCRICGRSPKDYTDVELHLHHLRPWSRKGLTIEENLITLCKTCHDGLNPHYDHELFDLLKLSKTYKERLIEYQKYSLKMMLDDKGYAI